MPDETPDATGKTTGFLKKRAGPLEYWQWGLGVVGLFAAWSAYKAYKGGGTSSTTASASPSVSTVPPSDIATTGANTALSGQLQDLQTTVGNLATQIAAIPS